MTLRSGNVWMNSKARKQCFSRIAGSIGRLGIRWMDPLMKTARELVKATGEIAAGKKRNWFGSNSLQDIEAAKKDLDQWCSDMALAVTKITKLSQPDSPKLAWAKAGSTAKVKISDFGPSKFEKDHQSLDEYIKLR
jgi:hypothetical protein